MWYEPLIKQCMEYEKCLTELREVCDNCYIFYEDKLKEAENLSNTTAISQEKSLWFVMNRVSEDEVRKMISKNLF